MTAIITILITAPTAFALGYMVGWIACETRHHDPRH